LSGLIGVVVGLAPHVLHPAVESAPRRGCRV
jgi:hypothetical protein